MLRIIRGSFFTRLNQYQLTDVSFYRCRHSGADKGERGGAREFVLAVQQVQGRRRGAMRRRQHLARLQRGERVLSGGRVRRGHGDRDSPVRGEAKVYGVSRGRRSGEHDVHHAVRSVQAVPLRVRQHAHLPVEN